MRTRLAIAVLCLLGIVGCTSDTDRVVVVAGTTLVDSGLIDALAESYESANPGAEISVVAEPTALALELGRQGAADLLLVHAPELESEFVKEGFASHTLPVATSRFILVGPRDLADRMAGISVVGAFLIVANDGLTFVSRSDGSGTFETEKRIWALANVDPSSASWYVETGQGMGPTLQVADQRAGLTLSEYGAFLAARDTLDLVDLGVSPEDLDNPYTGYVVKDASNIGGARSFLEWLASPSGAEEMLRANEQLFGEVVYQPASQ